MSSVLTAYQAGVYLGRCDERCYDAKSKSCHCICGGRNHGVGEHLASLITPRNLRHIKRELNRNPNLFGEVTIFAPKGLQLPSSDR